MALDRFLIAPLKSGLINNAQSWLTPEDSFQEMSNAYVWRGRVRKRFGTLFMDSTNTHGLDPQLRTRLRVQVGVTTGGMLAGFVPGLLFNIGQAFSVELQMFTAITVGAVQAMLSTGVGAGTYSTTNGAFNITGTGVPDGTPVFFYPALPVMGIDQGTAASINTQPTFAFDQEFAYQYNGSSWDRMTGGLDTWTGTDSQFFYGNNWRGILSSTALFFVTNFNQADNIRYWNSATSTWNVAPFLPQFALPPAVGAVLTARLIVPFHGYLVLLNTIESTVDAPGFTLRINRARWSWNGDPTDASAWLDGEGFFAGYNDASTQEQITGCEFIKDRLIVFFESSTWELVFTGNRQSPFLWQQINTELGVESTFSVVPFDKVLLGIDNVGVHACSGANVERIDDKIPDEVFKIHNANDGPLRIFGIRDFDLELVYWTFPDVSSDTSSAGPGPAFPTRILVYDYRAGTWAFFDDSFTAFGYYQQLTQANTWGNNALLWGENNALWGAGQPDIYQRLIVAGNQEGFMFVIDPDLSRNAASLQITNMVGNTLTIVNHNLDSNDYILIEDALGFTTWNNQIFSIVSAPDDNTIVIDTAAIATGYTGGGTVARVSQIRILSKQWNPYIDKGMNVHIEKINFLVNREDPEMDGEISVPAQVAIDYYPSSTTLSMIQGGSVAGGIPELNGILLTSPYPPIAGEGGTASLYPLEKNQERLWHPKFLYAQGNGIQLFITMNDRQMRNPLIALTDFQLGALLLFCRPCGRVY